MNQGVAKHHGYALQTGLSEILARPSSRRSILRQIGLAGLSLAATPSWAEEMVKLPLASGPRERPITRDFPQKGRMILQRSRPPLLETPMEVFDRGVFTPNDQFYVRWHWAVIPDSVDVGAFRLSVRGYTNQKISYIKNYRFDRLVFLCLISI